jgi:hypothetical protein
MSTYDVYIRDQKGVSTILKSESWNPDDAIQGLRTKGDFIPEKGDVVTRCIEVDRPQRYGRNGTRP